MDALKLDALKQQLLSFRERLLGGMAALQEHALSRSPRDQSGDLSGYAIHLADAATDSYDREFNLSLASHEQTLLNEIDAALERIERGEYGACESCAGQIGEARLFAVPYARFCLPCKERQERGAPAQ